MKLPDDARVDQSFITGNTCAAPCWYGLEIDKSSEADVMSVLTTLKFIDYETLDINPIDIPDFDTAN
jgi:hypothetical protein